MRHITMNTKSFKDLANDMRDRMIWLPRWEWPNIELSIAEEVLIVNGVYDENLALQLSEEWRIISKIP